MGFENAEIVSTRDRNADDPYFVHTTGEVSTLNSSTTPLGIGAVFTGTAEDIRDESVIIVSLISDVASAADGLSIQFSPDGTNWDNTDVYTIAAATGKTFSFQPAAQYIRVVYTNGGTGQTYFRLQVLLKSSYIKPSSHRIADSISGQDDAELTKAVITGLAPDATFKNVLVTNAGELKNSLENIDSALTTLNADSTTNLDGETGLNVNGAMFGRVSDTVVKGARLDASTESLMCITYEHHEIHAGAHFFLDDVEDLAINSVFDLIVITPAGTKYTHFTFKLSPEAECLWYIYEGAVQTVAGTTITPINNNRNSATTSINTLTTHLNTSLANANSDTDVTGATQISHGIIGAGRTGGLEIRDNEIILMADTIYCFRAIASAAGYINFITEWYEHTDRN